MEQPNNIDQQFRQRLQHAAVPPPDFVWANVERAIRRPRRRRLFFLWLFAACLTSAGLWALWQAYIPNAATAPDKADPTEVRHSAATSAANQQAASNSTTGVEQKTAPTFESVELSSPTPQQQTQSARSSARSTINRPESPQPASLSKQTFTPIPDITISDLPDKADKPMAIAATNTEAINSTEPLLPGSDPNNFDLSEISRLNQGASLLLAIPDRRPHLAQIKLPPIKKKAPKKCYDFHSNREAWLFDAYAGPSLINKRLDTSDPEYKSYVQDRLSSEKHQWAFNAGIRASYLFAGNFALRTGLHYDQFTEQFEYIDPDFIKYTVVITQQYVNGQWLSVPDTVDIQYGANYVKTYNRFALLDIPLQAALELRSGVTGISLNLGGSVNVLFQKRGSILSVAGTPVDLEQYQVFRPKVGLSLLGSIQWFFHLTPRTRVFAEPYYRHILEPVSKPGYPAEQSYGIGGIRFGVTQIFDRKGKG
ncbi:MAG: hypothetical protein H6574_09875 [Lewinellaceae bacterium]|nr:hypothetical protein [Saprospiraceae bacterium]MCB9331379.1 hypothetical protein [Lewinellaceae bacterium]